MKRILLRVAKVLGVILLVLAFFVAIITWRSTNYPRYSLQADPADFSQVSGTPDYHQLALDLVSQMTLEEKIDQLYGEQYIKAPKLIVNLLLRKRFPHVYAGRNERLNIPPWVLSDGPRGARVMAPEVDGVTTFPVAMARGASWNTELEAAVHTVIAREMRANGSNYAATPCINLLRHPAWGRAQETYGEDPWLLGKFGVAATRSIQAENVMACPKHFALNSLENSRFVVDVRLDERTLREVYLPHFKRTIQEGGAVSIMSAYNQFRGAYCAENEYLLTDILREEWGFDGFVSSDWVNGVYDGVAAIDAGLNAEMPWQNAYAYDEIRAGLEDGRITETDIDSLVVQSLRTRLPFAFANDQERYDTSLILRPEHTNLARVAAEESMVLLKNEGNILPFGKEKGKRIAVIGRLADLENTGDHGSSDSRPPYVITPYAGLQKFHSYLANEVVYHDGSDLESARQLAAEADEVVLVVGYTYAEEGEYIILSRDDMVASAQAGKPVGTKGTGGDRETLDLPATDLALLDAVAGANPKTALVYVGGSAIDMASWQDDFPAILFAWYSGMEGGLALARVLYGEVNPSGKLPFTIASDPAQYPPFTPYTDTITYGYYHGYTLFDKQGMIPLYPFGYGLSYTSFAFDSLQVLTPEVSPDGKLQVSIDVKNDGYVPGAEVVQCYVGFGNSAVDRPVKLLRGFTKVTLRPGEERRVIFNVAAEDLAWYNPTTRSWEVENMEYEVYAGNSAAAEDLLSDRFRVVANRSEQ